MRQLAEMVGISNPYLSQIERGLRNPSTQVLDAIASSLHTTADALMHQSDLVRGAAGDGAATSRSDVAADAGDDGPPDGSHGVISALRADPHLTEPQREALIQTYTAFLGQNDPGTP